MTEQSVDHAEHRLRVRTLRRQRGEALRPVMRGVDQLLIERLRFLEVPGVLLNLM